MQRAVMLHPNLVLLWKYIEHWLPLTDCFTKLSYQEPSYCSLGPLTSKRTKQRESPVVQITIPTDLSVLKSCLDGAEHVLDICLRYNSASYVFSNLQAFRHFQKEIKSLIASIKVRLAEVLKKSRCKVHYFSGRINVGVSL